MLPNHLMMQRGPLGADFTADRAFLCSAPVCCAVVAQSCDSHVVTACRSVKLGDRRITKLYDIMHMGAQEPAARGRLEAAHHTGSVSISQAPSEQPADRKGQLRTSAQAERQQRVRSPMGRRHARG